MDRTYKIYAYIGSTWEHLTNVVHSHPKKAANVVVRQLTKKEYRLAETGYNKYVGGFTNGSPDIRAITEKSGKITSFRFQSVNAHEQFIRCFG